MVDTFWSTKVPEERNIEDVTTARIKEYEAKAGVPVKLPVPIEKIVEQVLGLDFDWDEIEERMRGGNVEQAFSAASGNILRAARQQPLAIVSEHRP